jgi:HlyD family secretion protein
MTKTPNDDENQKIMLEQLKKMLSGSKEAPVKTRAQKAKDSIMNVFNNFVAFLQKLTKYVDNFINFIIKSKSEGAHNDEVLQATRGPILFGGMVFILFIVVGGLWAMFAPLDSAAQAQGVLVASSKKKEIKHQEGGIVEKIYIKQGDHVQENEPLIALNDTRARAMYDNSRNSYKTYLAIEDRLIAERDTLSEPDFSNLLTQDITNANEKEESEKIIANQNSLFVSRKDLLNSTLNSLQNSIEQHEKKIVATLSQKTATEKKYLTVKERLNASNSLLKQGYASKAAMQELESQVAELQSRLANLDIDISHTKQEIIKVNLQIIATKTDDTNKILEQLKEAQSRKFEAYNNYLAAKEALDRTIIRSPVEGIVNDLKVNFVHAVIGQQQEIAEITPIKDALIIEAKIPSKNIANVMVGLKAKIRFSAFKSRTTPVFDGIVTSVSADALRESPQNIAPGQDPNYYLAKIEINMEEFSKIAKKLKLELLPGMTAEVQIVTGERTLFRYLMEPITDNMFRAFVEK